MTSPSSLLMTGKVVGQQALNDKLRSLKIVTDAPLTFKAGQFTRIGLPGQNGAKDLLRAYSFVNAPDESPMEFIYDILADGGNLTPMLAKLNFGDEVLVSPRTAGFLVLDEIPVMPNLIFLATGTGVGPFLSILKTAQPWERSAKVLLVYGVRKKEDLCHTDLLAKIAQEHPDKFAYLFLVTREDCAEAVRMRIPQAIHSGVLQKCGGFELSPDTCQFLLCGNPNMISDTTQMLAGLGFTRNRRSKPGNLTLEKYW